MGRKSRRGQMWSFDLVLSLIIFFTAAIALLSAWNHMSAGMADTRAIKTAELRALTISDALIRTPGIPADWNEANVEVVGLSISEGILDQQKVSMFTSMDHDVARAMIGIAPYDFYFELSDINGTVYENTTVPPDQSASIIIPVDRYAIYNGRIARARLIVWG
ncbi:MAG: hypothetical protein V1813_02655 [Candidatus Aenigmatarchaeota archaeon]